MTKGRIIEACPRPDSAEIMFTVFQSDGTRRTYWKPWWRGHLHVLRLIFTGNDVRYVEPS